MEFSSQTRKKNLEKFLSTKLDILIIGGGITGAGLALQAGAKDMSVGLIEMDDFASGTSNRSTKLVHGGLRYLKQFEVELVSEITKERAVINQNAPHIVQPQKMLLPIYDEEGASFTEFSANVALDLYDRLAEVDDEWKHNFISKEEVVERFPDLKEEGLIKGGLYLDYINHDARLTTEILKKAHELGALLANYVKAKDYIYDDDKQIIGVVAEDVLSGDIYEIHANVVVNATGPWSDKTRNLQKETEEERMYPTKGVHLVVDAEKLPVERTIYTDTGLKDDRMIFIIPSGDKTYFGTTDTPYEGDLIDPPITQEDVDYLVEAVNYRFPDQKLTGADIQTGWAGLRPLLLEEGATDASKISRKHDVFVSDYGLVTIAGGKLTDYRLMAQDTFVVIEKELEEKTGKTYPEGDTRDIALSGGDLPGKLSLDEYIENKLEDGLVIGLTEEQTRKLIEWYGTNSEIVFSLKDKVQSSDLPLDLELSLIYALDYESTLTPIDFTLRRTDLLLFEIERLEKWKKEIVEYMAEYLKWTEEEKSDWEDKLEETISNTRLLNLK